MSWIYYFVLAVLFLFIVQGIYYLLKKRFYTFKNPLLPTVIAVFIASIMTVIQSYFF